MTTLTVSELLRAREAAKDVAELPLPMAAAFAFARLLRAVDAELETYEAQRLRLFAEYGEERDATEAERQATGQLRVTAVAPAHAHAFSAKLNELLQCPVTLETPPFNLATVHGLMIKPRTLLALGALVTMPDGPEPPPVLA
jgi:hypothetical protein